jgi:hypothetical protein
MSKRDSAAAWLREHLSPEGRLAAEIKRYLRDNFGLSEGQMHRVARATGVVFEKTNTLPCKSIWTLPTAPAV